MLNYKVLYLAYSAYYDRLQMIEMIFSSSVDVKEFYSVTGWIVMMQFRGLNVVLIYVFGVILKMSYHFLNFSSRPCSVHNGY
jgi:hypothetical protein